MASNSWMILRSSWIKQLSHMASLSCNLLSGFVEDTGDLRGPHVVLSASLPATKDLTNIYEGFLETENHLPDSYQSGVANLLAIPETALRQAEKRVQR